MREMKVAGLILTFISLVFGMNMQGEELPAFPGAEGHAKYVTGGRGGSIYYVTHLEDNNTIGSLRTGVEMVGKRIIVFKVSGTIKLKSALKIKRPNITIAGQTAPGDGISLRDYPVSVDADNVIIRFMRFRMGDEAKQEGDAIGGRFHKNIIVDHCSMSWSTDECVSFYNNENFTLQWSVISESLRNSVHGKGAHGYGGIWGGKNASFHHNLLAHHDSRNPRLGEEKGSVFALTDATDLRNNVIYNWNGNSCYGGEAMNVNIVNCYYKPGPTTSKKERIVSIDKLKDSGYPISNIWGKFHVKGNTLSTSSRATADNWTYGVYDQFHGSYGTVSEEDKAGMKVDDPHAFGEITTHTAEKAYEKVIAYAGASLVRDAVDTRIIHDVSTGTATFMDGGNGSTKGIIDTQNAVGGWPVLNSLPAPADTDKDGMPDVWEDANGLNKDLASDAQLTTVDGFYPNVEVYLNSLVAEIIEEQNKEGSYTELKKLEHRNQDLDIFFNQSTKELHLKHQSSIETLRIYSIRGVLLHQESFSEKEAITELMELTKGIYIVVIKDDQQRSFSEKLRLF